MGLVDGHFTTLVGESRESSDRRGVGGATGHGFHEGCQDANLGVLGTSGELGSSLHALGDGGAFAITRKDLLSSYTEPEIKESTIDTVFFLCRTCLALLLIGHAGFGFAVEKQMLINHWQSIGVNADVAFITQVGYAEFALGVLIFLAPIRPLIFLALLWKLFTEFLYVPADTVAGMGIVNIFEWIERWGDYGCLLYTSPSPRDGLLSRMPSSA